MAELPLDAKHPPDCTCAVCEEARQSTHEAVKRLLKNAYERKLTPVEVTAEIRRVAKALGWAIGEHGTKERDIDLIAVPWDGQACSRETLLDEILRATKGMITDVNPKPHGRVGYIIQGYGHKPIDLSIFTV
jgi:uracil phosphoribosyltransferase